MENVGLKRDKNPHTSHRKLVHYIISSLRTAVADVILTQQWYMNKIITWQFMCHIDYGVMCSCM